LVGLDSVSKAIRATCKAEGDDHLKPALEAWLVSPEFDAFLQMESSGAEDETLVNSFATVLRLTNYPAADDALARRILTSFFAAWRSEELGGDHAVETADRLSALRDQKTIAVVVERSEALHQDIAGVMAAMQKLAPPANTATPEEMTARGRIDAAKEMLAARRPVVARKLLDSVANVGGLPLDVRVSLRMTLGVAALRSGDLAAARGLFESVLADKPGDAGVLTNLSVLGVREKRVDYAVARAREAFEKSGEDRGIRVNYALALWHAGQNAEALSVLGEPSEWSGTTDLLVVAAQAYANLGQLNAMEMVARRALEQDPKNGDAVVLAGTAIMSVEEHEIYRASPTRLEEARTLFTDALKLMDGEGDELRELKVQALTNRAAVCGHLGELAEGISDCRAALLIDPEATQARRNLALFYLDQGETAAARDELLLLKGTDVDDSARILLARVALIHQDAKAALDEIQSLLEGDENEHFYAAAEIALDAYQQAPGGPELCERLERLALTDTTAAGILALHAADSDFVGAVERLQRAIAVAQGSDRTHLTITLADVYYRQKRFDEAALIYSSVIDARLDKRILRRYVIAEFNSGNWGAAAGYAARLRGEGPAIPTVTEIEARVYELTGQLERALELYGQLYAIDPKNPTHRLSSIAILVRMGSRDEAKRLLAEINIETLTTAESLLAAGSLRRELRLPEAIECYYRALLLDFHDEGTQAAFLEAFLAFELDGPSTVDIGCEVVLAEVETTRTWTIVAHAGDVRQPGQFAADTPPGSAVLGRHVGERVDLGADQTATVTEIRSKYAAIARRLYQEFRDRFPESTHIRFGDNPEELIEELKAGGRHAEAMRALYRRGVIGIGALADLTNRSPIETWAFLYFSPEEQLRASSGKGGVLDQEVKLLETNRTILLDASALCTMVELGVIDLVATSFDRVLVATRTKEEVHVLLARERLPLGKTMLLETDGEEVHLTDATAARQQARVQYIERIARAIDDGLLTVASPGVADMTSEMRTRITRRIGDVALASAAAAASEGAVVCFDDLVAHREAEWGWSVPAVSTLALLRYLQQRQRLTPDAFRKCQRALLDARYFFISTSVDELYDVLVDAAFLPTVDVMKHLTTLHGPGCDEDAAVDVLADLVRKVWLQGTVFSRYMIVDLAATTARYGRYGDRALAKLRRAIRARFSLMPQYAQTIDLSLQVWQRQNQLIST
jgi:tetratricopeptide (TPR) repeat protein